MFGRYSLHYRAYGKVVYRFIWLYDYVSTCVHRYANMCSARARNNLVILGVTRLYFTRRLASLTHSWEQDDSAGQSVLTISQKVCMSL